MTKLTIFISFFYLQNSGTMHSSNTGDILSTDHLWEKLRNASGYICNKMEAKLIIYSWMNSS